MVVSLEYSKKRALNQKTIGQDGVISIVRKTIMINTIASLIDVSKKLSD